MLDAGKAVAPDQGADRVLVQGRREAPGIELAALAPGAGLTPPGQDRARDMERDQAPVPDMDQDRVLDMDQDPAITDRDPVLARRASVVSHGERQF